MKFFATSAMGALILANISQHAAGQPAIPSRDVYIANGSDIALTFHLRASGGAWSENTLAPREGQIFSCRCDVLSYDIHIQTSAESSVQRPIDSGAGYLIRWDSTSRRWDIYARN
jgi:hypothetical protein